MEIKKALIVGIDNYPTSPLKGCVSDATEISSLLKNHEDGSPNFGISTLVSNVENVTSHKLMMSLRDLFAGDAELVLFYFAGHGVFDPITNSGYIITTDGSDPNWGISLSAILEMANRAYPKIKSTVIILDSCQSGFAGQVTGLGDGGKVSVIGNGVTILTACHREGFAAEANGHGTFTSIVLDGLSGGAADVMGRITPASLYAHVDQTLGPFSQRPIYKANVQSFITLRRVSPRVPLDVLRRLPGYFQSPTDVYALDPSCEPDRGQEAERLRDISIDDSKVKVYRELQQCNRNGLVEPVDQPHMWHAAIYSTGCKLTAVGMHYQKLAESNLIY